MPTSKKGAPRRGTRNRQVRLTPTQRAEEPGPIDKHWRTYFLQALAATSNVAASAREAGVSPSRAYKTRRENARFAAEWRAALFEGYEHLEMEVLASLRGHDPDRKLDIANAIRLLAAHRDSVAVERAMRGGQDEAAVYAALDDKIETIRQRLIAARNLQEGTKETIEHRASDDRASNDRVADDDK